MSDIDNLCDQFMLKLSKTTDVEAQAELMDNLKIDINAAVKPVMSSSAAHNSTTDNVPPLNMAHYFHEQICPKIRLYKFTGKNTKDEARDFIRLFNLMSKTYQWDIDYHKFLLKCHILTDAAIWLESVDLDNPPNCGEDPNFLADFTIAFEKKLLKEPDFIIRRKLDSLTFDPQKQELDEYILEIKKLSSKLGTITAVQLAVTFLSGLPDKLHAYCLSTDIHTLQSYTSRARIWLADHVSETKQAKIANTKAPPTITTTVGELEELILSVTEQNDRMRACHPNRTRNRERSYSPERKGARCSRLKAQSESNGSWQ